MATTRRKRRTSASNSPLEDILGGIAGTTTRRRSRKPTVGGITGSKASSSIFLTIAAICFAVGYYLDGFEWLYIVGIALAIIYLIVAYFKNRKKTKEIIADNDARKAGKTKAETAPTQPAQPVPTAESHLSASQSAQITDRLHTHPELQQLHPRLTDAAKVVVHKNEASQEVLTTTLKLSNDEADTVLRQLEIIGIIGSKQDTGQHTVYVTNEDELSEWLKLLHEL